jgi:UDP-glucose 4-epimerase
MQSRDFTYIDNVVQANVCAMEVPNVSGEAFNIACGARYTLMDIVKQIEVTLGIKVTCKHTPSRAGDVRHTLADISKAERLLGFKPTIGFEEGMAKTIANLKRQHESRQAASA